MLSKANAGTTSNRTSVSVGGAQVVGDSTHDTIGVNVRIVDANTGEILDAVNVQKEMKSATGSVSGLSGLTETVLNMRGRTASPITVDDARESSRKESVDSALRACMELAVVEPSKRFQP